MQRKKKGPQIKLPSARVPVQKYKRAPIVKAHVRGMPKRKK